MRNTLEAEGKLALVFATISRPHAVQRLVMSVRKYCPNVSIYIADQSSPTPWQKAFYAENNCKVVWMDHDVGVCASRNAAVDMVKEPYFVLCDDDFILTEESDFSSALTLLNADKKIGVVGGRLIDIHESLDTGELYENQRFWELNFHYDRHKGSLLTIPVHYFSPDPKIIEGVRFFECDAVMNFAVFRTEMFDDVIRWDPLFKSNGEHEDFYLNLKVNGKHRVVYTPQLLAQHHHPPLQSYSNLRNRSRGWQLFLEKWGLRQYLELDGCLRITNDVDKTYSYAMGYEDFYSAPALTSEKRSRNPGTVTISNVTNELVSSRQKAVFQNDPSFGTDFRNFRIGLDQSVFSIGGSWHRNLPKRLATSSKARFGLDNISNIEWSFIVSEFKNKAAEDLFVYIRPSLDSVTDQVTEIPEVKVLCSIAKGGSYAIFCSPVQTYSQSIFLNNWNAIALPNPNVFGNLAIELVIIQEEKILYEGATEFRIPLSRT